MEKIAEQKKRPRVGACVVLLVLLGGLLLPQKPEAYTANDADKEKNAKPDVHDCSPIFELMTSPIR